MRNMVSSRLITTLFACASLFIILAGVASKYASLKLDKAGLHQYHIQELTRQFDLDVENNISTYYQSMTLFFCSFLLGLISWAKRGAGDRYSLHWRTLAIIFLLLSVEESASFHEAATGLLRARFDADGYFHFAWVVPAIGFVLILAISYLPFLLSLQAETMRLFAISGAFYICGAVGMEMVGGRLLKLYSWQSFQYAAGTIAEETLEMIGVWIFIYALLSYLSKRVKEMNIEFK